MYQEADVSQVELDDALEFCFSEVLGAAIPQDQPIGIALGGQPATGKSLLISRLLRERHDQTFVVINGDDLRHYHPRYHEYNTINELEAANQTQAFANTLVHLLFEKAVQYRYSIIIEGTMRNPSVPIQTFRRFREAGYRTEAHVLAVNFLLSQQGIYYRYEHQKAHGLTGRFSPLNIHQQAYNGLLQSVDTLYSHKEIDDLSIYDRGAKTLLARYTLAETGWSDEILPSVVIEKERNRRMTFDEKIQYALDWETILDLRRRRGAEPDDVPESAYREIRRVILYNLRLRRRYRAKSRKLQRRR